MNLRISAAVYQKELLEIFRDRRTMISMVVVPLVAIPLMFNLINRFMSSRQWVCWTNPKSQPCCPH